MVSSNGNAKNCEIKIQPNFASPKRQKINAAKIVCLTLYKPITLNSKLCTVSLFQCGSRFSEISLAKLFSQ